jgi:DNA-binding Lrp family transcriptional regulator
MHFNELLKEMNNFRLEISRPTLSNRLKHLENLGYIKREETNSQQVDYSLDFSGFRKIKEFTQRTKEIIKSTRENQKEFFALPEKEQIDTVLYTLAVRKLNEIQARIEYELEPQSLEKQVAVQFYRSPVLQQVEAWMIKKSIEDEIYRRKILKIIGDWLERSNKEE